MKRLNIAVLIGVIGLSMTCVGCQNNSSPATTNEAANNVMEDTLRRLIKFMNRIAFPGIFGESNPESDKLCVESIIIGLSDRGKTDIFM